jgi:uncharacterized membrane protein
LYSYDGTTWYQSPSAVFGYGVNTVAWNTVLWVAGGNSGYASENPTPTSLAYSSDGINWRAADAGNPFFDSCWGVAWNGSKWLAIGNGSSSYIGSTSIVSSTNGISWKSVDAGSPVFTEPRGIAWNGFYWIAVGYSSDNNASIAKSSDGVIWVYIDGGSPIFTQGECVAWNGQTWVAGGISTGYSIATSTDGITWTPTASGFYSPGSFVKSVAWNSTMWALVGLDTTTNGTVAISEDGNTWSQMDAAPPHFFSTDGYGMIWNAREWIATGSQTSSTYISSTGLVWTQSTPSATIVGLNGLASRRILPYVAIGSVTGSTNAVVSFGFDGGAPDTVFTSETAPVFSLGGVI